MPSAVEQNEVIFGSALLATEAAEGRFRARDFRFYLELFANWLSSGIEPLQVQNTQITRYLTHICDEGYAKQLRQQSKTFYTLTRAGVIGVLSSMTERNYCTSREKFFFLHFYLKSYRSDLLMLSERGRSRFPSSLKAHFLTLLDTRRLLEQEIRNARDHLRAIKARRSSFTESASIVEKLEKQGEGLDSIISTLEKIHPYELNSMKRLSVLLHNFPEERRLWEITDGNLQRAQLILTPSERLLEQYLRELEALLSEEK